jgi:IclR family transcriptional regulator, acetate operon repressor
MNDPTQPNPSPRYGPKTPLVAIRILGALTRHERGLSAQSLANRCDLKLPSAYRHLDSLIHAGLVYKSGNRYLINPGMPPLGNPADHEAIDLVLKEFVKETNREIALATLHDGRMTFTHLHANSKDESLLACVPSQAVHATAAGKALLAALPKTERRRLLDLNGLPAYTEKTITDPDELEARLQPDDHGIWTAAGEYCEIGACMAVLADSGRLFSECVAVTTSVTVAEFEGAQEQLTAALHRVVVLLIPLLGPLLHPETETA